MDALLEKSHQLLIAGQIVEYELRRHKHRVNRPSQEPEEHLGVGRGRAGTVGQVSYPNRHPGQFSARQAASCVEWKAEI